MTANQILAAPAVQKIIDDRFFPPGVDTRTHGPGVTYFVMEYRILDRLAGSRGITSHMLALKLGTTNKSDIFRSAMGYLKRRGWIACQNRNTWHLMPPGQAYLDEHPMRRPGLGRDRSYRAALEWVKAGEIAYRRAWGAGDRRRLVHVDEAGVVRLRYAGSRFHHIYTPTEEDLAATDWTRHLMDVD